MPGVAHDARPRRPALSSPRVVVRGLRPPAAARLALAACRRPARFIGTDPEAWGAEPDDLNRPWLSRRTAATFATPLADPVRTRAAARRFVVLDIAGHHANVVGAV